MSIFFPPRDIKRFMRAAVTNQFARFAPNLYLRLTGQTGRGAEGSSPHDIAEYFFRCFDDYQSRLAVLGIGLEDHIRDQALLEYGPGDLPGVALLMYAHGAKSVTCADRFAMVNWSSTAISVLNLLLARLPDPLCKRAASAFKVFGDPATGFRSEAIDYLVSSDGCVHQRERYALIYSRAVLEHVNDLDATFRDIESALLPGGVTIHEVDLKSHGLHRETQLDFLCWPEWAWHVMHSNKGVPNRLRIDRYRALAQGSNMKTLSFVPVEVASNVQIQCVRGRLDPAFQTLTDEELAWLSFWMILEKPN
jgi:hypothetical protein